MISVQEARDLLNARVATLAAVETSVIDATGMRLAEAVNAVFDLPADDVSVMDGYAARSTECGFQPLPVSVSARAGMAQLELPTGAVARIQTGAVIPTGADAVVAQEQAVVGQDGCVTLPTATPGQFIRRAGEVRAAGETLAEPGQVLTPQLVGLLVAAGPQTVRVIPRVRLFVLTTGSELVGPADRPGQGKIRDSNAHVLRSLAAEARLIVNVRERISDSRDPLLAAVHSAAHEADVIVTSGGVSVGDYDLVRSVIEDLGGEILFHRVAMRPGKPTLVAKLGAAWVVGLPGNPLSALVGWHLFVRPLTGRLAGDHSAFEWASEAARLAEAASNPTDRTTFAPALLSCEGGHHCLQLLQWKGSHDLYTASRAGALAILAPGLAANAGDAVPFLRL